MATCLNDSKAVAVDGVGERDKAYVQRIQELQEELIKKDDLIDRLSLDLAMYQGKAV